MSRLGLLGAGAVGVFRRDASIYLSYRTRALTRLATVLFSLTLFYYISRLIRISSLGGPGDYFAFVVVGLAIFEVLQSTLAIGVQLRSELMTGTFERLLLSPFGPVPAILAMMLFPVALSALVAVATLVLGALLYGLPIDWASAPLALPVALLGSLAFAAFGLLFTAAVVLFKQATAAQSFVVAGISLVSGVYFPVAVLPGWVRWAAEVQPFKPTIDLLRHLLIDTPMPGSVPGALAKLVAFDVVLLPLSGLVLGAAIRRAQRKGTILEY